jgi:hypothetical protein
MSQILLIGTLEKLIRQKERWEGVARAWRRRAELPETPTPDLYRVKAGVLQYCCDDLDYVIDQMSRRMPQKDREEAHRLACEKSQTTPEQ